MQAGTDEIFVSIAAYRDPQLGPTIHDLMRKAVHPERVRVGVCWQRDVEEAPLPMELGDARFRVLEVDYRDSRGACWARAEAMRLWRGEPWFLQLDSHCRVLHGWDRRLIEAAEQTGAAKPVLSTYASPFRPGKNEILAGAPLQIVFQAFTADGLVQLKPGPFAQGTDRSRPVPARFLAAGFLFAPGSFVEEVPYDPEVYFVGEECSMTVRAWTSGYDLFHPAETLVWHDYGRHDARRHWTDHTAQKEQAGRRVKAWGELDLRSRARVQTLLLGEPLERFGLGRARTLEAYERYAGLSFAHRKAQQYTARGLPPPNPPQPDGWEERVLPWITRVHFPRERLPEGALKDVVMWSIALQDAEGFEVARLDAWPEDLEAFGEGAGEIVMTCEFPSETAPVSWVIQPQTRGRGWLAEISGQLGAEDVAVIGED